MNSSKVLRDTICMEGHCPAGLSWAGLVSSVKKEKFQVAINLKGKNRTFVSLMFFFKLPLVNDLKFQQLLTAPVVNGL